ncbi:MAG: hypothetical protein WCG06_05680, partial [Candidatus Omnitrophota bacterium]
MLKRRTPWLREAQIVNLREVLAQSQQVDWAALIDKPLIVYGLDGAGAIGELISGMGQAVLDRITQQTRIIILVSSEPGNLVIQKRNVVGDLGLARPLFNLANSKFFTLDVPSTQVRADAGARMSKGMAPREREYQNLFPSLTREQAHSLYEAVLAYGLSYPNDLYLGAMYVQYLELIMGGESSALKLIDREQAKRSTRQSKGEIVPAALFDDNERQQLFRAFSYVALKADPENAKAAKLAWVILNQLDGGIGQAVDRLEWLRAMAREQGMREEEVTRIVRGAKGTDLGYILKIKGKKVFVSIAEAKMLELIQMAKSGAFAKISFQPLVNWESKKSYEALLKKGVLSLRTGQHSHKLNYQEAMEQAGIEILPMLESPDLPGVEEETGLLSADIEAHKQGGGHGQFGFYFNAVLVREDVPGMPRIRVFLNGDNRNSSISAVIIGAMIRHRWPIVKMTTVRTPIDAKVGLDGGELVWLPGADQLIYVSAQMELAQARNAHQTLEFEHAGLKGKWKGHGRQPFNTNIIAINDTLLIPVLKDLLATVGPVEFYRIFAPSLIRKDSVRKKPDSKAVTPLEGAIGISFHNLNKFFMTDPRGIAILKKHNLDRILYFI